MKQIHRKMFSIFASETCFDFEMKSLKLTSSVSKTLDFCFLNYQFA